MSCSANQENCWNTKSTKARGKIALMNVSPHAVHSAQWWTGSRLLRLGESIDFRFHLPTDMATGSLHVFGQYLEQAHPGDTFAAGGDLDWLDALTSETIDLAFAGNTAFFQLHAAAARQLSGEMGCCWRVALSLLQRRRGRLDRPAL